MVKKDEHFHTSVFVLNKHSKHAGSIRYLFASKSNPSPCCPSGLWLQPVSQARWISFKDHRMCAYVQFGWISRHIFFMFTNKTLGMMIQFDGEKPPSSFGITWILVDPSDSGCWLRLPSSLPASLGHCRPANNQRFSRDCKWNEAWCGSEKPMETHVVGQRTLETHCFTTCWHFGWPRVQHFSTASW